MVSLPIIEMLSPSTTEISITKMFPRSPIKMMFPVLQPKRFPCVVIEPAFRQAEMKKRMEAAKKAKVPHRQLVMTYIVMA